MKTLKHIGKIKNTGAKVLVVFRTLPGESNQALVLPVAQLPDSYHDSIMTLVESDQAQECFEFGEIMFIRTFPDGRPMLQSMQADSRLQKLPTDLIIMTPTPSSEIQLDQLNLLIAEQKNCAVDDLCTFVKGAPRNNQTPPNTTSVTQTESIAETKNDSPLTDKDLARRYRSQADAMYKEAARLRREADDLDPPAKKISTKTQEIESA